MDRETILACAKVCEGDGEEGPDAWGWHQKDYAKAILALLPAEKPNVKKDDWFPSSDILVNDDGNVWSAGIDDGSLWGHRIQCHGNSAKEAEELRDMVLRSLPAAQDEQGDAEHPWKYALEETVRIMGEKLEAAESALAALSRPSAAKQELPEEPFYFAEWRTSDDRTRRIAAEDYYDLRTHIENRRGMLSVEQVEFLREQLARHCKDRKPLDALCDQAILAAKERT